MTASSHSKQSSRKLRCMPKRRNCKQIESHRSCHGTPLRPEKAVGPRQWLSAFQSAPSQLVDELLDQSTQRTSSAAALSASLARTETTGDLLARQPREAALCGKRSTAKSWIWPGGRRPCQMMMCRMMICSGSGKGQAVETPEPA